MLDKNGDFTRSHEIDWSKIQDPSSWEVDVFTGLIKESRSFGSDTRQVVEIQQEYGLPMTILRIDPEVD